MKNKNIWIINHDALPPTMGGLSRHYYFAKELINRGNKVSIFTNSFIHNNDINMIPKEDKNKFKEIDVEGVKYTYVKGISYSGSSIKRIKNILDFMFDIRHIKDYKKGEIPDVIYASSPNIFTLIGAYKLAKKMNVPFVAEVRDLWPLSIVEYKHISKSNPVIFALYKVEKWIYKNANALIFTMAGGKQYVLDKGWDGQVDLNKIFNVNNGIDIELQMHQKLEYTVDDDDVNGDDFTVLYAGSIREANGVEKIVDIAEKTNEDGYKIKYIVYGRGDKEDCLRQAIAEKHIDNVILKGCVENKYVPYICNKSSVNITDLNDFNEIYKYGLSMNKLINYFNAGKPIICRKSGFDLLEKYGCGIPVDGDSGEAYAKAIETIYDLSKEDYDKMCEATKAAANDHDYKVLSDKLCNVFEYAIANFKNKQND